MQATAVESFFSKKKSSKRIFFTSMMPLKNDEICFLSDLKSLFRSQDI